MLNNCYVFYSHRIKNKPFKHFENRKQNMSVNSSLYKGRFIKTESQIIKNE